MSALLRNLRYAIRVSARSPGLTLTVVLTLAIAIGANTAVFSAVDAILLRPLPFPDGDRLVRVMELDEGGEEASIAPMRLEDWNASTSAFETITGYFTEDVSDATGEIPERVRWAGVAPSFFEVWGIAPALGRSFVPADSAQIPTVVVISDRYWRNRLGADPNVLDRSLKLNEGSFSVIGVMPPSFLFPNRDVDIWFPNFIAYEQAQSRSAHYYAGVGRLAPGVTPDEARADLELAQARLAEEYPATDRDVGVHVVLLKSDIVGDTSVSLWVLFGAVSLLLLIACTNIASLLLSRAAEREHEVAVRYSLGASRSAVVWQMLTEAGILALAGATLGVLVAAGADRLFGFLAPELPRLDEAVIDARILVYTAVCAVVVTLACGSMPAAWHARAAKPLSRAGRTQVSARHSLQWGLVGVQVALSVTLLAGAGLLLRSFDALSRVDPGFVAGNVLAFRISGTNFEYVNSDVGARIERTIAALGTLSGVESVATTTRLPGLVGRNQAEFELVETSSDEGRPWIAEFRYVSPSYFETVQIPLLGGEPCREPEGAVEVMVNRSFAGRFVPDRSPIGLHLAGNTPARIVGIVGDAREVGVGRDPVPVVYSCISAPTATPWFLLRTRGRPAALTAAVRARVKDLEPLRSVYSSLPLAEHIGGTFAEEKLRTILLLLFAAAAVVLACLGVYGTLSYVVNLRRREVGLRMALGALSGDIVRQFLRKAVGVVGIACVAGLVLSLVFTRTLSGMLFGISPTDPPTLSGVVVIIVVIAMLAALIPALRASRIEPMRALRED